MYFYVLSLFISLAIPNFFLPSYSFPRKISGGLYYQCPKFIGTGTSFSKPAQIPRIDQEEGIEPLSKKEVDTLLANWAQETSWHSSTLEPLIKRCNFLSRLEKTNASYLVNNMKEAKKHCYNAFVENFKFNLLMLNRLNEYKALHNALATLDKDLQTKILEKVFETYKINLGDEGQTFYLKSYTRQNKDRAETLNDLIVLLETANNAYQKSESSRPKKMWRKSL